MQGNDLNIIQTQNISIGSQTFTVMGTGTNFTQTNTTTKGSHSAAHRLHEPGLKTFILIAFLLFATQAYAQKPDSGLIAIENQYISQLGAVLDPLVVEICDLVTTTPATNIIDEVVEEIDVLFTCLELLMITITGLTGGIDNVLAGNLTGATLYGSSLPITNPLTLFTAAAADSLICLELVADILNGPNGNTAAEICNSILATAAPLPTVTAATPPDFPPRYAQTFSMMTSMYSSILTPSKLIIVILTGNKLIRNDAITFLRG